MLSNIPKIVYEQNVIWQFKGPPCVTCTLEGNRHQWQHELKNYTALPIRKTREKIITKSEVCWIIEAKSSFYKLQVFCLFYYQECKYEALKFLSIVATFFQRYRDSTNELQQNHQPFADLCLEILCYTNKNSNNKFKKKKKNKQPLIHLNLETWPGMHQVLKTELVGKRSS